MAADIRVSGLREFKAALKQIDTQLGPELRIGLNEVAQVVINRARPQVPRRTGRAAASMKPGSTQDRAQIKVGGNAAPHYPWLDFGGSVGRGHRPGVAGSGSVKRPFIKKGRYVYPTAERAQGELIDKLEDVLGTLTRKAGF